MTDEGYNMGVQPIDRVMSEAGLSNKAVVEASTEMITFKVVQKARKGRRLTRRMQDKVVRAINHVQDGGRAYRHEELFNYDGG